MITEPIPAKQTLIPQYTIRQLLAVMTACSVVFVVVAQAVRGTLWAIAASVGVLAVAGTLLVHAGFFAMIWFASRLYRGRSPRPVRAKNPVRATAEPGS